MPVMDGFVATKRIREHEAMQNGSPTLLPLPIIAITANVMPGVQQRCSDAGMDGYVRYFFFLFIIFFFFLPFFLKKHKN
jgi:CheY-like chemotaxis protein